MEKRIASAFYNASAVTPQNDPVSSESAFAVDRIRNQLEQVIEPGMEVLDLCCGAGRFSFAMEEMGATVTGVDCATIPLDYANSHLHK